MDDRVTRLATAARRGRCRMCDGSRSLGLNSVELVEAYLAVLRVGAICVPVNFRLVTDEIAYVLTDSGAMAVDGEDALTRR